ncbi:hypothetical protein CLOBY_36110 [Clostridium saccharobutylicum]|nr:DUF6033 family protein [Clostridium saccharobutylicum]AQS11455.1 hypothetical protein CLOBY_36110 [Clostridium saccharobutylicum]MBC2435142.1 hypothetical protein [Clostridium saccharobutylicum]NSB88619.1 hypothetical protein [Clostridium saccharobutylicum]NYC30562.1 hypothetical protein [Clostridium saccharobutylicum]
MPIGINNSYSSYYTQASDKTGSNNDKTKVSDTDKTKASSANTIDKTISKEEYFKNICERYSGANLRMSNSHLNKGNEIISNVSPQLINKAISDPKAAENLNRLLDQMSSIPQYINNHKYTLDGREVKNVSFVIDENGGVSCKCEYVEKDSKNTSKTSDEEKLRIKRMKERKERNLKLSKEHKIYNDIAVNIDMSFLDRFDTNI